MRLVIWQSKDFQESDFLSLYELLLGLFCDFYESNSLDFFTQEIEKLFKLETLKIYHRLLLICKVNLDPKLDQIYL